MLSGRFSTGSPRPLQTFAPGQCIPASAIMQFSMNIQRKNSAHHFRMQSEREQTLAKNKCSSIFYSALQSAFLLQTCAHYPLTSVDQSEYSLVSAIIAITSVIIEREGRGKGGREESEREKEERGGEKVEKGRKKVKRNERDRDGERRDPYKIYSCSTYAACVSHLMIRVCAS